MTSMFDDVTIAAKPPALGAKGGAKSRPGSEEDGDFERAVTDLDKRPAQRKDAGATPAKAAATGMPADMLASDDTVDLSQLSSDTDPAGAGKKPGGIASDLSAELRLSDALRKAGQQGRAPTSPTIEVRSPVPKTNAKAEAEKDGLASDAAAQGSDATSARTGLDLPELSSWTTDGLDEPEQPNVERLQRAREPEPAESPAEPGASPAMPVAGVGAEGSSDASQLLALLSVTQAKDQSATTDAGSENQSAAAQARLLPAGGTIPSEVLKTRDKGQAGGRGAAGVEDPSEAEGSPTGDRLFRFASADGKTSAMSVAVSAEGARVSASGESQAARPETVTVLEARRYLGLATNVNSQAVAAAIAGDPALGAAAMAGTDPLAQTGAGRVMNTLRIQMHPIDLGTVTATLKLKDDALQVELRVETGEAYRQLSDDQDAMMRALKAQGFNVDQITLIFTPSASGDSGQAQQNQSPQGQAAQGGRDQQNASSSNGEGRHNDGNRNRQTGQEARQGAPVERPGSGLPGGASDVYI